MGTLELTPDTARADRQGRPGIQLVSFFTFYFSVDRRTYY